MNVEAFGYFNCAFTYFLQDFDVVSCLGWLTAELRELVPRPLMSKAPASSVVWISRIFQRRLKLKTSLVLSFKMRIDLVSNLLNLLLGNYSSCNQFFCIAGRLSLHRSYLFVHYGLGKARLVNFIVTVESETDHINQDVFLELLPVSYHQLRATYN